jgi:hypothetical protein
LEARQVGELQAVCLWSGRGENRGRFCFEEGSCRSAVVDEVDDESNE